MKYVFSTKQTIRYIFPTHINDLIMDRSDAEFSEVFITIIEAGRASPLHKHDDTEQVFYMLEGHGKLQVEKPNSIEFDINPGDLIRIPVSKWHTIKANQGVRIKYLVIDCFGSIRNSDEPTWDSHVKVLCKEQGWDYKKVKMKSKTR